MSRDIKSIGMDVHKEAVVIAVLNRSGKLVMESIVETKASSILEFIHGLRGELHVTWEEGTWAAWLYDLLQPQVAQVLVSGFLLVCCHENYLRLCRFLLQRQCDRVAQTFQAMNQVSREVVLVELV